MSLSTVLYIMSVLHGVKFLALAIFIISILACLYYLTKAEKRRVVQSCAALLISCMVMVTIPNTQYQGHDVAVGGAYSRTPC